MATIEHVVHIKKFIRSLLVLIGLTSVVLMVDVEAQLRVATFNVLAEAAYRGACAAADCASLPLADRAESFDRLLSTLSGRADIICLQEVPGAGDGTGHLKLVTTAYAARLSGDAWTCVEPTASLRTHSLATFVGTTHAVRSSRSYPVRSGDGYHRALVTYLDCHMIRGNRERDIPIGVVNVHLPYDLDQHDFTQLMTTIIVEGTGYGIQEWVICGDFNHNKTIVEAWFGSLIGKWQVVSSSDIGAKGGYRSEHSIDHVVFSGGLRAVKNDSDAFVGGILPPTPDGLIRPGQALLAHSSNHPCVWVTLVLRPEKPKVRRRDRRADEVMDFPSSPSTSICSSPSPVVQVARTRLLCPVRSSPGARRSPLGPDTPTLLSCAAGGCAAASAAKIHRKPKPKPKLKRAGAAAVALDGDDDALLDGLAASRAENDRLQAEAQAPARALLGDLLRLIGPATEACLPHDADLKIAFAELVKFMCANHGLSIGDLQKQAGLKPYIEMPLVLLIKFFYYLIFIDREAAMPVNRAQLFFNGSLISHNTLATNFAAQDSSLFTFLCMSPPDWGAVVDSAPSCFAQGRRFVCVVRSACSFFDDTSPCPTLVEPLRNAIAQRWIQHATIPQAELYMTWLWEVVLHLVPFKGVLAYLPSCEARENFLRKLAIVWKRRAENPDCSLEAAKSLYGAVAYASVQFTPEYKAARDDTRRLGIAAAFDKPVDAALAPVSDRAALCLHLVGILGRFIEGHDYSSVTEARADLIGRLHSFGGTASVAAPAAASPLPKPSAKKKK